MSSGPETLDDLLLHLHSIFADVEMIIHAGDITSQVVLDELEKFGTVEAVRGNMDRTNLPLLPEKKVLDIKGNRIGVMHGWGAPKRIRERLRDRFEDVDAIVYGHTHEPFNEIVDGVLFFNPGSPTEL